MKKIYVFLLIIIASQVKADVELVPLDMELGYWETTTQIDVEGMLAKIPEEQRAMLRGMMSSKMKVAVIKQCITQDTLKDMKAQIKKSLKSAGKDCDLQVIKSTSQEFNGVLTCARVVTKMTISTKSINSKRLESQINTGMGGLGGLGQNNIKTIGEWKSEVCPKGVE